MRSCTKSELSRAAGVSPETFRRWLKSDRAFLEANGIRSTTKLFPPKVVKYLCEKYSIDI
jgi:DeoR/GlpR family transcriptional regulator of sugar metabolism